MPFKRLESCVFLTICRVSNDDCLSFIQFLPLCCTLAQVLSAVFLLFMAFLRYSPLILCHCGVSSTVAVTNPTPRPALAWFMVNGSFMTATWVVETMAAANALLEKDRLVTSTDREKQSLVDKVRPWLARRSC